MITRWALIACALSAPEATKPRTPEAQQIAAEIQAVGAEKVLERLHEAPKAIMSVLRGIESGDRSWLKVGQQLLSGADGGWAYELNLAFGNALRRSAGGVLELAPEIELTCGNLDDRFTDTLGSALAEVGLREKNVRRVTNAALAKEKVRCLEALAELRRALPKAYRK